MKHLIYASAVLALLCGSANANIIKNLGNNPNSATGQFSNSVLGATFEDQYTFNLIGGPQFLTFASATNDFTSLTDRIANFTGQLFNAGSDGLPGGIGTAADFAVGPLNLAGPCPLNPTGCQVLSGSAILAAGSYYLDLKGTGGGTSGYGGNLTTSAVAVPGPVVGAGFPGLVALLGGIWGWKKRRQSLAA